MTKEQTCAERLPAHLASRLEDFRAMTAPDFPDEGNDELPRIDEYPLAATIRYAVRVELSTGGPADYLEAIVDTDGEVSRIAYHFADWFDHAEQSLTGDEFEAAEAFILALYGGDLSDIAEYVKDHRRG